ncbi:terminase small subunit [Nitratiruptor tergarcus]|uniref:Phage terminase, small subunit n=1 Tax=Nitratiruptor tergarcus DSM 16512 TaxID=1069081 RepID=A0A1W1WV68_9BACT|nr:terminase small subunit [Nitratiruptor tergarcus]SMC10079.1 Phage terminase, small subunit [Nitratiruptor tergarcus DSM 16512]
MGLTKKQEAFCINYVATRDAKASALKAGYSKSYAEKKAYALLGNETVSQRIEELEKAFFNERFTRLAMRSMAVLEEILEGYDDRARLAAVKEIFRFNALDRKLGLEEANEATESVPVTIVFNEIPSRKKENNES